MSKTAASILTLVVAALVGIAGASCSDDETAGSTSSTCSTSSPSGSSSAGQFETSCRVTSDCTVVNDCCDGCGAADAASYTPTPCGAQCIIDPCSGEHGVGATSSAVCNAGTCELVVSNGSGTGGGNGDGGAGGN
jgi:hypothetical protein